MRAGRLLVRLLALLLLCQPGRGAAAEIFKWTDEAGRVHFAQDLGQVPPRYRAEASAGAARPTAREIQTFRSPEKAAPPARIAGARPASEKRPTYRIQVEQAGSSMVVPVEINGGLVVPFHIDTGASDVVLPQWAAALAMVPVGNSQGDGWPMPRSIIPAGISFWEEEAAVMG